MKLWGVGLGPGDPELVSFMAVRIVKEADVVFVPLSGKDRESVAGHILESHVSRETVPFVFPMIRDEEERDGFIAAKLDELRPCWEGCENMALPVIGDSALYATVAYFYDALKKLCPSAELELVPGISAHSLASCRAGEFMALGRERFSVVPGTASVDDIMSILASSDSAVIYKPSALGSGLASVVDMTGPWKTVTRIDRAGLDDERILRGRKALEPVGEYLSVVELLRWR